MMKNRQHKSTALILFLLCALQVLSKSVLGIDQQCLLPAESDPEREVPFEDLDQYSIRLPSGSQAIITSYQFQCSGRVTRWKTYVEPAHRDGFYSIRFQVWRPGPAAESDGCYSLVGEDVFSNITLNRGDGLVQRKVNSSTPISVQPGDVLGYFTSSTRGVGLDEGVQLKRYAGNERGESVWYGSIADPGQAKLSACPFPVGFNRSLGSFTAAAPVFDVHVETDLESRSSSQDTSDIGTVVAIAEACILLIMILALISLAVVIARLRRRLAKSVKNRPKKQQCNVYKNPSDVSDTVKQCCANEKVASLTGQSQQDCNMYEVVTTHPHCPSRQDLDMRHVIKTPPCGPSRQDLDMHYVMKTPPCTPSRQDLDMHHVMKTPPCGPSRQDLDMHHVMKTPPCTPSRQDLDMHHVMKTPPCTPSRQDLDVHHVIKTPPCGPNRQDFDMSYATATPPQNPCQQGLEPTVDIEMNQNDAYNIVPHTITPTYRPNEDTFIPTTANECYIPVENLTAVRGSSIPTAANKCYTPAGDSRKPVGELMAASKCHGSASDWKPVNQRATAKECGNLATDANTSKGSYINSTANV